jgi:TonB family protein
MRLIHLHFSHSLLAQLASIRARHDRLQRLLDDRPTGFRVGTREKNPEFDLKPGYLRRLIGCCATSLSAILVAFVILPDHLFDAVQKVAPPVIIQIEDIPETTQRRRPPPAPRPSVPLAVDDEDVPEDITIEITDLDLNAVLIDLPAHSENRILTPPEEEEALAFWKVEEKPELVEQVALTYPPLARKADLEGTVYISLLVRKDGRVGQATILKGPDIFHKSALAAVSQFVFTPGKQNKHPVQVWMTVPIQFTLFSRNGF